MCRKKFSIENLETSAPSTCAANSFVIDQPAGGRKKGSARARACVIFIEWHVSICMYIGWVEGS